MDAESVSSMLKVRLTLFRLCSVCMHAIHTMSHMLMYIHMYVIVISYTAMGREHGMHGGIYCCAI